MPRIYRVEKQDKRSERNGRCEHVPCRRLAGRCRASSSQVGCQQGNSCRGDDDDDDDDEDDDAVQMMMMKMMMTMIMLIMIIMMSKVK